MFIKIALLSLMFSSISYGQTIKKEEIKRLKTNVKLGIAAPKVSNGIAQERKVFTSLDLSASYAITDKLGADLTLSKWIGKSTFSNGTGGLAYNMSLGGIYAVTGSLIDRSSKIEKTVKSKKQTKAKDYYIVTKRNWKEEKRANGFRVSLHVSQYDFVELKDSVYGVGGSVYYEIPWGEKYSSQIGMKSDFIDETKIKLNVHKIFISVGF